MSVAKNGCLLLSVPVRGDGTIDSEERHIVEQVGSWTQRFGEAICAVAALERSGEGPTQIASGQFGEGKMKPFTAAGYPLHHQGAGAVRHHPGPADRNRGYRIPGQYWVPSAASKWWAAMRRCHLTRMGAGCMSRFRRARRTISALR